MSTILKLQEIMRKILEKPEMLEPEKKFWRKVMRRVRKQNDRWDEFFNLKP